MDLSIIIISYNTKELLHNCLISVFKSLKGSGIKVEVIVVDNYSTDGTREMLASDFPKVMTLLNAKNVGFGRANNQGIEKATGEYVLLLNSDTVVLQDAIPKLYAFNKQHPNSFIGAKLVNLDHTPQTSCGPFFSLPVVFAALFLKGDYIGLTRWSPDTVRKVDWVSGACIMAPKKLFLDDLLFDERIFLYMEEVDLLYRAKQKGYSTYFYPRAFFVHLGTGSSTTKRKGPVLNIYKGLLYFYQKHYSPLAYQLLRVLLSLKAALGWVIGMILGKTMLKETYEEAYQLV